MTRWFLVSLTGCSIALSGCSMALSGPSPDRPRMKAPQCDTSKGLVVADALIAGTLGIVAASVASSNGGAAILPLIGAGVFTASAIHGNNVVNACHRDFESYDAELAARAPLPAEEPREPVVAMQPAVALPSQPQPQVQQPPPLPPPPQRQPQAESQPQPPPQQEATASDPWAAFWKETP